MKSGDSLPELAGNPLEKGLASSTFPSAALKQRVLAAAVERPAPTRSVQRRRGALLAAGAALVALSIFAYAGGARIADRSALLVAGTALGTAAIAVACVRLALFRGSFTLGRGRAALWALVLAAVPTVLAWKILWSAGFEGSMVEWPTRPGFRCLGLTLAMAVPALLSFAWSRRGSEPRHPTLVGFAAGIAIGTVANVLTDLWCPIAFVPHLLLGHALPTLLLGLLGATLGWGVVRMRGNP